METKTDLNEATIEKLQELIEVNLDSREGFTQLAEKTEDVAMANLFRQIASERADQASELQAAVFVNDEDPKDSGSTAAAAHRMLIDIRTALGGGLEVMLIEAERGEDKIKQKYEGVLKDEPGTAVSDVLHRHYSSIKAAHDRIRDLRDSYKS